MSAVPERVVGLPAARQRWGVRADEVASAFWRGDPLEGRSEAEPPTWFDVDRCERGGATLRRYGLLTAVVLRCLALPLSYRSPVGVLPLVHTDSLVKEAFPRLYRTAEYVVETQALGAWRPGGGAWRTAARVRAGHEAVRRSLRQAGWRAELGAPIPQPDIVATACLFGPITVEGLRRAGVNIDAAEADDVAHLSRIMAWSQGADDALCADDHEAALDGFALLTALHGPTSTDGQALMQALLDVPMAKATAPHQRLMARGLRRFYRDFSWHLLGPEDASALGVQASGRLGRWLAAGVGQLPWSDRLTPAQDAVVRAVLDRGARRLKMAR